jgi:linoleate 8R-lipoxygenase/9,12-octadecadienoate 8-hydroperoxide 8R-isomerase
MANVEKVKVTGFLANLAERLHHHTALSDYGVHMSRRLLDSGLDAKDIVWSQILPTAGGW